MLLGFVSIATAGLGSQLANLTVRQGAVLRDEAEAILVSRRLVPTVRGRILDRKGRELAADKPSYDIAIDYKVITGYWVYKEARREAYKANREIWSRLDFDQKEALIQQYADSYEAKRIKLWDTICQAGNIEPEELEERRQTIIKRVQTIWSDVWGRRETPTSVREEFQPHTVLRSVPNDVAFAFRKLAKELPGIYVRPAKNRLYQYREMDVTIDRSSLVSVIAHDDPITISVEHVGDGLIGRLRDVWAKDLKEKPFRNKERELNLQGYLPGDLIGSSGIERAREEWLRGHRGRVITHRDTKIEERTSPVQGRDVRVSIDIALQARVRAIMDPALGLMRLQTWHSTNESMPMGEPLYGAAIVLDVATNEVMALVSTPTVERATDEDAFKEPEQTIKEEPATHAPKPSSVNRAIAGVYPPGSTVKPLVYAIAAQHGVLSDYMEEMYCNGALDRKNNRWRCWCYRPPEHQYIHGPVNPVVALAKSCNIFFYLCGKRMGPEPIVEGMRDWGFWRATDWGLYEEVGIPSRLRRDDWREKLKLTETHAMQMAIGQGQIAVPPIQVASAHAALARGGVWMPPILYLQDEEPTEIRNLELPSDVLWAALKGMYESGNNAHYGTGHHIGGLNRTQASPGGEPIINFPDATILAKTGTAQAPIQFDDKNRSGKHDEDETIWRAGSHGWYVALVRPKDETTAKYVVVVLVEYGGSGGRSAGPVVNQILYAMQAEGYL